MKSFHEMLDLMKPSPCAGGEPELKHYMFFSNLKAIKLAVDEMLSMDSREVDAMLADGHDWAADHMSTSKDDVEEVHAWLRGRV